MAVWNKTVLTTRGLASTTNAATNSDYVNITRVACSDADFASIDLAALESLPDEKQAAAVTSVKKIADNQIEVEAVINNVGVTTDYQLSALGLYAKIGTSGDEFLFVVKTAVTPDTVPATTNGVVKTTRYVFLITITEADKVTVNVDMKSYMTRSACIDIAHPIGCYHFCDGSYNPADKFGGEWQKVDGKYVMASGTYNGKAVKAGDIVGEELHKISYNEMPRHGHTRGTQNIWGSLPLPTHTGRWDKIVRGAFTTEGGNGGPESWKHGGADFPESDRWRDITYSEFNANRNWTGISSIEGMGEPMQVMPRAIVMDIWRRIA